MIINADTERFVLADDTPAADAAEQQIDPRRYQPPRHCQLEQSEGDFRRFASAIHQLACDV